MIYISEKMSTDPVGLGCRRHFTPGKYSSTMKPHGMGDLNAAQTVCVGFHTSPGEGACDVMTGYYENSRPSQ